MKVRQALDRLRMRCSRSECCRAQAEKLLLRWIARSAGAQDPDDPPGAAGSAAAGAKITGPDAGREDRTLCAADIPYILDRLEEERFIDDRRFAGAYVRDKLSLSRWGKNKIRYGLHSLGISAEVAAQALEACGPEEAVLRKVVEQKWNALKKDPLPTRKMKVLRFAAGRGFGCADVLECLQELIREEKERD